MITGFHLIIIEVTPKPLCIYILIKITKLLPK